jgi:TolB protein
MKSRTILIAVLSLALVPVALVGGCLMLAVGAGIANYRDDVNDRARAAADPRLKRPLVSTSGRILFVAQNDATDDLYIANVNGSGLFRLTQLPHGSLLSRAPQLSPDRSRVAISSDGVLIVPTDRRAEPLRLDRPGGSLAWSPDGRQIASIRVGAEGRFQLYVFNADGSGQVRDLATTWPAPGSADERGVDNLEWSPDGKRFAFVYTAHPGFKRSGPRYNHLYFALADGTWIRNVSLDAGALPVLGGLSWSPDGRTLAFGSGGGLATIDADLNWREVPVALHGSRASQQPSWSPDSARLAWFTPDSIVVSDTDGGHQQELTRGRCRGVHPSWSPDGRRIAFTCHEDGGGVFVMNADGSGLTAIANIQEGRSRFEFSGGFLPEYPVWLPD